MRNTKAETVEDYLAALSPEHRAALEPVRTALKKAMPKGYAETVAFGMISYGVPLSKYPDTYNGQPLCYVALAAQKNYCALYLMSAYGSEVHKAKLVEGFRKAGKKLDMGKSCIRFRTPDDLPLPVIREIVGSIPVAKWIEIYEGSRKRTRTK